MKRQFSNFLFTFLQAILISITKNEKFKSRKRRLNLQCIMLILNTISINHLSIDGNHSTAVVEPLTCERFLFRIEWKIFEVKIVIHQRISNCETLC